MTADHFTRNVTISIVGHAAVMALIFLRTLTVSDEMIDVRNAIRVDVVALPQKMETMPEKVAEPTPAPPPKPLPEKVVPPAPKPAPPVVPVPSKAPKLNTAKAEKNAMAKLKAMEAMEKFKEDMAKSKTTTKPKAAVVAGNQKSEGDALTGLEKIEYEQYFHDLEAKVHAAFSIPQYMADFELKAQVLVLIDDLGSVTKKSIKKSSGNEIFDTAALDAIAAAYPPPPKRLHGKLSTTGVVFFFPEK